MPVVAAVLCQRSSLTTTRRVLEVAALLALLAAAPAAGTDDAPEVWDGEKFVPASEAKGIPSPQINIQGADTAGDNLARLDEDELLGRNIPKHMQCDACSAVVWHVDSKLQRLQRRVGARQLKGYEVLEAMESVCTADYGDLVDAEGKAYDWGEYSVKTNPADKTKKVLAGPGCTVTDQSGFGQYGGFRSRLMAKCEEVTGREAEGDIYAAFNVCRAGLLISFRHPSIVCWFAALPMPSRCALIAVQLAQDAEQDGVESSFEQLRSFLCQEECGPVAAAKHPDKKKKKKGKKNKKVKKKFAR